jgi:peptide-methionine (S)-S-oxide reductase
MTASMDQNLATLGGGCFWCLEAVYQQLEGVEEVVSGYAGGDTPDPSYKEVCSGSTGHAEVVQITFVPELIDYRELLEVFFTIHNPTTANRQGADVGTQYRSIILYHSAAQEEVARELIGELEAQDIWEDPVVTEVEPLERFYRAEPDHQDYYRRNSGKPYCQAVIAPKVAKLRAQYMDKLKS